MKSDVLASEFTPIAPALLQEATPQELAAYEQALERYLALEAPHLWATHIAPTYFLSPPHIRLLSETIVDLLEDRLLRPDGRPYRFLAVSMPPRHGKSELISKFMPAWFLARYPSKKVILASYNAEFAASWGRKVRNLLEENPGWVEIRQDSRAADAWETKQGGGMWTAGVGGGVTGKGANVLIVDDPVKDAEEANSETIQERNDDWWQSTSSTRLEPGGKGILVMTRWAEGDLRGKVIERNPDDWYILDLPAISTGEPTDVIGRLPGEPLWPERYDKPALAEIRSNMKPYWWSALFQQTPMIDGGGIFEVSTFRYANYFSREGLDYYRLETPTGPKLVRADKTWTFGTMDLAISTKNQGDFTVLLVCAVTPEKDLIVINVRRARVDGTEHEKWVDWAVQTHNCRYVGIEKATFGATLLQNLLRRAKPVRELIPDKDKVTRAYMARALLDAGKVYFLHGAAWLPAFEHELLIFDHGAHDDQVDCFAYAAREMARITHYPHQKPKEEISDIERITRYAERMHKTRKSRPGDIMGTNF